MATVNEILAGIAVDLDDPDLTTADDETLWSWIDDALLIFKIRLFHLNNDMALEEEEVDYSEDDQNKDLPSGVIAIKGRPWIDGTTTFLDPILYKSTELELTESGTPSHYKIWDDDLYIYPPTDEDRTIKFNCLKAPTAISDGDDTIPFNGIYDIPLKKYILERYKGGLRYKDEYGNQLPGEMTMKNSFWSALQTAEKLAFIRSGSKNTIAIGRMNDGTYP